MNVIRLDFYEEHLDLPVFETPEEAKNSKFVTPNGLTYGYAVLFEINGKYAVYVHHEDRYYSSYLPVSVKILEGGKWNEGSPVEWTQIGTYSKDEQDTLRELGLEGLIE